MIGGDRVKIAKGRGKDPGPRVTTLASDYGDQKLGKLGGNIGYDHIVAKLPKDANQRNIAQAMLEHMEGRPAQIPDDGHRRAANTLIGMTQISEEARVPGAAKEARAHLHAIANGETTFKKAFAGRNPDYAMARKGDPSQRAPKQQREELAGTRPTNPGATQSLNGNLSDSSDEES